MMSLVQDFMKAKLESDIALKQVKKVRLYLVRGTRQIDYEIVCKEIDELKRQLIHLIKNGGE